MPDGVNLALSPMKLDSVDLGSDGTSDVNVISKAYENIINANGGIVLNQNKITNSASFKLALLFDSMDAMAPVNQINSWVNLWIKNHIGETGMTVEYSNVSPYFVDDRIDKLTKVAQYSVPCKLELASLLEMNPVKERGMSFLEDALGLGVDSWNQPLISSNVMYGKEEISEGDGSEGRKTIDTPDDLTDEGEKTRDVGKNDK